jgi:phosphohistidine phosphatase
MKTVVFMRHGHAEDGNDDHARELSAKGREAVDKSGAELRNAGFVPDVIVTSTAERARVTAELVARALGYSGQLLERRDLYLAEPGQYLQAVRELDGRFACALLVAHNPGLESLAHRLGQSQRLSPAAFFRVERSVDTWEDFGP